MALLQYYYINQIKHSYHLNGIELHSVESLSDLRVLFCASFGFGWHVDVICSEATKMLGFILRISKPFQTDVMLQILYDSLVRNILEYSSII